jgi:hypothetical protein
LRLVFEALFGIKLLVPDRERERRAAVFANKALVVHLRPPVRGTPRPHGRECETDGAQRWPSFRDYTGRPNEKASERRPEFQGVGIR